ncbi:MULTISPECIES: RluA family pseudouridine synthase [unclassified Saccharibacter]|uniref:RluA family pseudouridine synthase n=1 Tax=unclassified Saccharibacter TaxID=2648722 RepID=UPI001321A5C5|nr:MULTISPECIES: RNA pseudouridine synthase [unclassified Saccharibacter]MXV35165.1 RNA pseudouridine synthase [Saccharibacter sp. EH611]MXV57288.1 RNA pseudouridine synthase [Saccharibacter sp. EH70]MXV64851.1 RNA pseudouridine synthase [Saccharibacter sp. EH60]
MAPPPLFKLGQELPVLFENPHFLVVNKPAGLAVHPGPQTIDSVETRLTPQKRGGPWLVHRLDRDTSGCLLIARRKTALIDAQSAFASRQTQKLYWAIVEGKPNGTEGHITMPVHRVTHHGRWHMEVTTPAAKGAQNAETHWRLLGHHDGKSWLELRLLTGRTHQARLHCQALGTPIVSDTLYGTKPSQGPMQLLARSLRLELSNTHIAAEAPPTASMQYFISSM